jgi:hypothetical protein
LQNEIAPVEKVARVFRIVENEDFRKYATQMYNVGNTVLKMLHQQLGVHTEKGFPAAAAQYLSMFGFGSKFTAVFEQLR